jgi:hypothetical protein
MTEQPSLFDRPIEPFIAPLAPADIEAPAPGDLAARFEQFHKFNPHVYKLIVQIAQDLQRRGHKRGGIAFIFERLRWLYAIQTQGEEFKLNNNYKAFYARKVMQENPSLAGFFEIRAGWHQADQ